MNTSFIFTACLTILFILSGCGEAPGEYRTTLGTHEVTIIDSSGKPYGGNSGTSQDDVAQTITHTFESANGRYKMKLEDKILTINGNKYTLAQPTDSIRIVEDQVEINDVKVSP